MVRKLVVSVRIIFIIEQSHVTSIVDLADPYLRGTRTRPGSKMNIVYHAMRRAGSMPTHPRLPIGTENAIGSRYQTGILAPTRHECLRAGLTRVGYHNSIDSG